MGGGGIGERGLGENLCETVYKCITARLDKVEAAELWEKRHVSERYYKKV